MAGEEEVDPAEEEEEPDPEDEEDSATVIAVRAEEVLAAIIEEEGIMGAATTRGGKIMEAIKVRAVMGSKAEDLANSAVDRQDTAIGRVLLDMAHQDLAKIKVLRHRAMGNNKVLRQAMVSSKVLRRDMDSSKVIRQDMDSSKVLRRVMDSSRVIEKNQDNKQEDSDGGVGVAARRVTGVAMSIAIGRTEKYLGCWHFSKLKWQNMCKCRNSPCISKVFLFFSDSYFSASSTITRAYGLTLSSFLPFFYF